MAAYFPSLKLSKLDEHDMLGSAVEARANS